jgi:phosphate transport system substrate-binding protein
MGMLYTCRLLNYKFGDCVNFMHKTVSKMSVKTLLAAASLGALMTLPTGAQARDRLQITGSSTVFPFTTAVAEKFGQKFGKAPIVESTGTGGGMQIFCSGVGANTPDVTNASRRMKTSEFDLCKKNGVSPVEVKIGYDGIAFAQSKKNKEISVTTEQMYLALAAEVPGPDGKLVKNPYQNWSEIDPRLPVRKISVLGPPPTSGTRDSFNELAIDAGCKSAQKRLNITIDSKACMKIREDGAWIDAGENDMLIVQKLDQDVSLFGVFGFSFLEENRNKLIGSDVNGVDDSVSNIQSGKYPLARSMYIYAKKEHIGVIPGLKEFLTEYTSEAAFGDDGYLAEKGMVPLPKAERDAARKNAMDLTIVSGL